MELFIVWIGTVIVSFAMELTNELRMFKDAADNGYKIDIKRLSEFSKQMNPDAAKTTLMSLLIPIMNIIGVMQRTLQYNNVRYMILDQLSVIDTLIPMTKEDKEKYKEKPSSMKALIITVKSQTEDELTSINYTDGDEKRVKFEEKLKIMAEEITSRMRAEELTKSTIQPNEEKTQTILLDGQKQQLEDLKNSILNQDITTKESDGDTFVKKHR